MLRSPSEASMRGPTPGSSITGRERRSVRVVRARRGAHRGRPDLLDDRRHLAPAAPSTFERNDLPARYLEHRPDIEGCPKETLRPSYAPALGQILQRAHGKEDPRPSDSLLSGVPDLVEVPTLVDTAQGLEQDQTRPHLGALGIEYVDGSVHHPSGLQGRVVGATELARERENQDIVVVGERLVGLDEGPGGGLSRCREDVGVV